MTFACPTTEDFFRLRLDHMIDLRHPLAVLASRMPWQDIQASVAHLFSRKARSGKAMPDLDLFGEKPQRQAVASKAARPRVPLRTMIALLYLKHAFNQSDEAVVERWGETPTWQFFSGRQYFEHQRPCDATTLVKFRQLLGEEGVEELLAQTIQVAVDLKLIKPDELTRVIVDSTVQHKAIAPPTDSRLLEVVRGKLVQAAKAASIASTLRGNLIVGARAFHGNPYDGHTLNEQLEQAAILMQDTALRATTSGGCCARSSRRGCGLPVQAFFAPVSGGHHQGKPAWHTARVGLLSAGGANWAAADGADLNKSGTTT